MADFDIHSIEPMVLTANDRNLIGKTIISNNKASSGRADGVSIITNWSAVDEKGKIHNSTNPYCYAGLRGTPKGEWKFIVARMMHDGEKGPGDDARHSFIDYIINRSPYSPAFVATDLMFPDDTKKEIYGYNVCRTDVPANLIAGGLTAIRMAWEFSGNVAFLWRLLTKHGCDEDLAYAYAFQAQAEKHKYIILEARSEGHSSWDGKNFSKKTLDFFLNWKMKIATPLFIEQTQNNGGSVKYAPICRAWGGISGDYYYGRDCSYLADERKEVARMTKGEKKASANPFTKVDVEKIEADKFCEVWAGVLMQKCHDLLANRDKKEKVNVA